MTTTAPPPVAHRLGPLGDTVLQELLDAARDTAPCRVPLVGAVGEGRSGRRLAPLTAMARAGVRVGP